MNKITRASEVRTHLKPVESPAFRKVQSEIPTGKMMIDDKSDELSSIRMDGDGPSLGRVFSISKDN